MKMLSIFAFLLVACNAGTKTVTEKPDVVNTRPLTKPAPGRMIFTSRVVKLTDHTYGYIINQNDVVFIKQLTIPGKPGKSGFVRETDAQTVSKLVIAKIVFLRQALQVRHTLFYL